MTNNIRGGARTPKDPRDKAPVNAVRSAAAKGWRNKKKEEELERERAAKEKARRKLQSQLLGKSAVAASAETTTASSGKGTAAPTTENEDPPVPSVPAAMPTRKGVSLDEAAATAASGDAHADVVPPEDTPAAPPDGAPAAPPDPLADENGEGVSPAPPNGSSNHPDTSDARKEKADGKGLNYERSDVAMGESAAGGDDPEEGAAAAGGGAHPTPLGSDVEMGEGAAGGDDAAANTTDRDTPPEEGAAAAKGGVDPTLLGFHKVSDPRDAALPESPPRTVDGGLKSPEKKKQRKSKRDKKEKKKKKEIASEKKAREKRGRVGSPPKSPGTAGGDPAPSPSALRSSRYGKNKDKKKDENATVTVDKDHAHKHKRIFIDGKITMMTEPEDEHLLADEYVEALRNWYTKAKKVDCYLVIESKEEGRFPHITQAKQLPMDHAELSRYFSNGDRTEFRRQKPWGDHKSSDSDGKINPSINFTMCISADEPIKKVLKDTKTEFQKTGGTFMKVKGMASFEPETFCRAFRMHHSNSLDVIDYEFEAILLAARDRAAKDDKFYQFGGTPLPAFQQRWTTPQIPGVTSRMYEHWPEHLKRQRSSPHFECDASNLDQATSLVDLAKKYDIFKHIWGEGIHVSAYRREAKISGSSRQALAEFSKKHVETQESFTMDHLVGIVALDSPIPYLDSKGEVIGQSTLRQVLYSQYVMSDNVKLFWEIHQGGVLADVDIVRAKTDEAKYTVEQMNKNIACYLTNDLVKNKKMPLAFVEDLVRTTIEPTLVNEVGDCKWDPVKMSIWTPRDAEMEAANAHENAGFYINIDSLLISGKGKKDAARQNQRKATAQEMQKFNDAGSFATLNVQDDDGAGRRGYAGDAGVPTFSLGKAKAAAVPPAGNLNNVSGGKNNDGGNKEDGVSALSGTSGVSSSRRELVKLQQELAEAMARIKTLSEPRSTASRKGSGSSSVESLSSTTSSSDGSNSPAPSTSGSDASGPSADDDA